MHSRTTLLLLTFLVACGDEATPDTPQPEMDASVSPDSGPSDMGSGQADARLPAPDMGRPMMDAAVDMAPPPPPVGEVRLVAGNTRTGFVNGVGAAARFNGVTCTALDPDGTTLYASDTFNGLVRTIDLETGDTRVLAGRPHEFAAFDGTGSDARFSSPRGCAVAPDGSALYVADGPSIRRITLPDREVTTLAGAPSERGNVDAVGSAARLGYLLHDLETSADGRVLYISDRSNDTIRTLDLETGAVATVVGPAAGLNGPGGLHRINDILYIADTFNDQLRAYDTTTGEISVVADGIGSAQGVAVAGGIAWAAGFDGLLYRISLANARVTTPLGDADEVDAVDGDAETARLGGAFASPTYDADRGVLYYVDNANSGIRVVDLGALGVTTLAGPSIPSGYLDGETPLFGELYDAVSDGESVFVADPENSAVRTVNADGVAETLVGDPDDIGAEDGPVWKGTLDSPVGLAYDAATNRLFIADSAQHVIRVVDFAEQEITTFAGTAGEGATTDGDRTTGRLQGPWGLALASDGRLFVTELDSGAVRIIDAMGGISTLAPAQTFDQPLGIAVGDNGRVYVADNGVAVVYAVDPNSGTVEALVGQSGQTGVRDGAADVALLSGPWGLEAVESGLLIVDSENNLVRRFDFETATLSSWLGHPVRAGGLAPGAQVTWDEMTFYRPREISVYEGVYWVVSQAALFRASGR